MYALQKFILYPLQKITASIEEPIFSSHEFCYILPWICWCSKEGHSRVNGRTVTAIEDNLLISFLSSLTVTVCLSKKSVNWVFLFSAFSSGRLSSILWTCMSIPRNLKVDIGVNTPLIPTLFSPLPPPFPKFSSFPSWFSAFPPIFSMFP